MDVADDIVVTGRNVHVPEGYREHVRDKLTRVRRYDDSVVRYEVELLHEPNPKQSKTCQRVEITGRGAGMLVRAEACGPDFYTALDCATAKLATRLRRAHDRRRVHHGLRQPTSVAEATANTALPANTPSNRSDESDPDSATPAPDPFTPPTDNHTTSTDDQYDHDHGRRWESTDPGGPGRIVREKHHSAEPITVDQALYEMELVGHDFYLFVDAADSRASVVYRRKGFDYGIVRLT